MASTSITNDDRTNREMESIERPTIANLLKAAIKGENDFIVKLLGLYADDKKHTEEENEGVNNMLKSSTLFGDTVLHILVANEYKDLALEVIHKDASLLKAKNRKLETPLHCAVRVGNWDVISILIKYAPEVVYEVNNEGLSPFHLAIAEGKTSVAESMLKLDSSPAYAQFSDGMFPVHVAACMDNTILLELLLDKYLDSVKLKDSQGRNFFHVAAEENKTEVFTKVFKKDNRKMEVKQIMNLMIKAKDYNGNTPLHIAAKMGNRIIMKAIWESLHTAEEINNKGLTPFDLSEIQLKYIFNKVLTKRIKFYIRSSGRKFTTHWFDEIMELSSDENKLEKSQLIGLGSVLITTVAFAAAFTIPGGYNSVYGTPMLGRRYMFRAFILANAFAFVQAFVSVFILVLKYAADSLDDDDLRFASYMFVSAANCMVLAFGTGSYVMLAPISMPMSIIILVLALLFGSPTVFIIYYAAIDVWKVMETRYTDPKYALSIIMTLYGLPLLFIFCLPSLN